MTTQVLQIPAGQETLMASLHLSSFGNKAPLVIICHGFIGSRIGVNRLFVHAANRLAAQGYHVLRFDYAGCGESTGFYGKQEFQDLIDQTRQVIDYVEKLDVIEPEKIVLLGHSLGGAVATCTASIDTRIDKLILWAPVAYPFQDIVSIVGYSQYTEAKEKQVTDYQGYLLHDRFFDSMTPFNPLQQTRYFKGDVLVLHGSSDEEIPAKYCFYYEKAFRFRASGNCDKELIIGADHTFTKACYKEKLIESTTSWLTQQQWENDMGYNQAIN